MKKSLLMIMCLLSIVLAGCSKQPSESVKVEWNNGVISVNGKETTVDKYGAEYYVDNTNFTFTNCQADDLSLAVYNSVGVAETDMSTFKKSKYFQQFLGTELSMYYSIGDTWYNCANGVGDGTLSIEQMCQTAYDIITKLDFGAIEYVKVNDVLKFKAPDFEMEVRPDGIVIPGYFKISTDYNENCTEPIMIGDATVNYYNSGKYCYYQYGDLLIQTAVGVDLAEHIQFL